MWIKKKRWRKLDTKKHRGKETPRQTGRESKLRDSHPDVQTERERRTDGGGGRQRERQRQRERERETERQRDRETERAPGNRDERM